VVPFVSPPAEVVFFADANFSNNESTYIDTLFQKHGSSTDSTCASVILQHLWKEYGMVFADPTLMYSILAWGSSFDCRFVAPRQRLRDHWTYKSIFLSNLGQAIVRDEINECHFFAVLFAVLTSFYRISDNAERSLREFDLDNEELTFHQKGLLRILQKLGEQRSQRVSPMNQPLQYLYNYALSLVRLWASEGSAASINYEMHLLAENTALPVSVPDARATFALPAKYWLSTGGTPTWQGLEWSISDDIRALFSCFQTILMLNQDDRQYSVYTKPLEASICALRQKIVDMQKLPCVRDIFDFVFSQLRRILTLDSAF
jgi:hypothetical protein